MWGGVSKFQEVAIEALRNGVPQGYLAYIVMVPSRAVHCLTVYEWKVQACNCFDILI